MAEENSGCSIVWTSDAFASWRKHVDAGDFTLAEREIETDRSAAADEARDLLQRLRYEWSLTTEAMFAKLAAAIPDVTRDQLDAWTASGAIQSKMIDGERRYFRREPRNLFLFDIAARNRQERAAGKPTTADRHESTAPIVPHLIEVLKAADASPGVRELLPVRTRFNYAVVVKPDRPGSAKGSTLRAWLPFPQHYAQQQDVKLIDCFPRTHRIAPTDSAHRTIYFEQKVRDPTKAIRFEVSFEYTTSALCRGTGFQPVIDSKDTGYKPVPRAECVAERPPHIVFTDKVRAIVEKLSADSPDKPTLANRIWNWVDDEIPWRAEHEYCLIPSAIEQALRLRRGDCGIAALTLITLCRCAGIPARWQSGWTTDPSTGGNMHDWTEVWLDEAGGWIPVDPSYGKKKSDDPLYKDRIRDFYFGGLDRYRLIVNTDYGMPLTPAKTSLRSEPLDFQRGEIELDGRNLYYDEWDYAFSFEHSPIEANAATIREG
jgi:transglutaminase-like putative cysteine protease